jgi:hypothetical protein
MQSSARRDRVRELVQLARVPEPGTSNLGEFVAGHADELAQALNADPHRLALARALDDEELLPRIVQLLERARGRRVMEDLDRRRERSIAAAVRLGQSARWNELGAELDVDLLLGDVLADRTRKWVTFEGGGLGVTIPRHLIAGAVFVARQHLDLAACVDEHGLHFRWRGGTGKYNWRPQALRPGLEAHVLTVPLASKVVAVVLQRPPVVRQRRRRPALEPVLAEPAAPDVTPTEQGAESVVVAPVVAAPARRRGGPWLLRDILLELGHI